MQTGRGIKTNLDEAEHKPRIKNAFDDFLCVADLKTEADFPMLRVKRR
jgi:hypothetical protein